MATELLSCMRALIYHDREPSEQPQLQEQILNSVETDEHRREVRAMGQSMAEFLLEKGYKEGHEKGALEALRQALLDLLRSRFRKIPKATERLIAATDDRTRLQSWIVRFATASSLADIGIGKEDA